MSNKYGYEYFTIKVKLILKSFQIKNNIINLCAYKRENNLFLLVKVKTSYINLQILAG